MDGSDPLDSMGAVGGTDGQAGDDQGATGWGLVATYDGAAALIAALLDLDADAEYTKTELSDASGVAYKTLYLDGTVEALVDAGFLEREQRDGEETTFRIATESSVFEAAAAFETAAADG
ncbi:hypothetical protein SAMN05216559_1520 [Halomicrobium zhouii]|uniref:Uncharacterized protein n=1 Tax=Halomicrobium zhouii TaxID=767519 RepID=A0A1I6KTA9_9EURY|nr:hypothetical protein [Halomicrobium zhouii]SFR94417.1 hypothetical protein SAMN05216559_1520 [Halomicrobium zhouii]